MAHELLGKMRRKLTTGKVDFVGAEMLVRERTKTSSAIVKSEAA